MKKIAALIAARALGMSAFAGVASAVPNGSYEGTAYGKYVIEQCGYSFGQLRQLAKASEKHPSVTPSIGAKAFAQTIYPYGPHCMAGNENGD